MFALCFYVFVTNYLVHILLYKSYLASFASFAAKNSSCLLLECIQDRREVDVVIRQARQLQTAWPPLETTFPIGLAPQGLKRQANQAAILRSQLGLAVEDPFVLVVFRLRRPDPWHDSDLPCASFDVAIPHRRSDTQPASCSSPDTR